MGDVRSVNFQSNPSFGHMSVGRREVSVSAPVGGAVSAAFPSRFWLGILGGVLLCVGAYVLSRSVPLLARI